MATRYIHKKRGTEYVLIDIGKMQSEHWLDPTSHEGAEYVDMREVAIYCSVNDGSFWVRPLEEFEDGRFEKVDQIFPKEPAGWFLDKAVHEHSKIVYKGDAHEELPDVNGSWLVSFQRKPEGGLLAVGRGHTITAAWAIAVMDTKRLDEEYPRLSTSEGL